MNSVGLSGAIPTSKTNLPLAMSISLIVARSRRTNKALSGLLPSGAPFRDMVGWKLSKFLLTQVQKGSPFGSNTTHGKPLLIDTRRNIARRRTLTYFQSVCAGSAPAKVHAPQTRMPSGFCANAVDPQDIVLAVLIILYGDGGPGHPKRGRVFARRRLPDPARPTHPVIDASHDVARGKATRNPTLLRVDVLHATNLFRRA